MRLHDCHWPNPDVIDIHVLFPNWEADPLNPASYDFHRTDEYIKAILQADAAIVFRLGESIEHTKDKRWVHPPKDFDKWAIVCSQIVRHYTEGWGNGFHYNIKYWEIWNEPENRPAMWTGTDDQFLQLYRVTAKKLKADFPRIKVGGPGFGHFGELKKDEFIPSKFFLGFLNFCRKENLPLDFLSWHCYSNEPHEIVQRAQSVRKYLDQYGFAKTESHLNEWNYLPDKDWNPMSSTAVSRQKWYHRMSGVEGAVFAGAVLALLQTQEVDQANFFHGETGGFGLFNDFGVPNKAYWTLNAFGWLPNGRLGKITGATGNLYCIASMSSERASIFLAVTARPDEPLQLHIKGLSRKFKPSVFVIDANNDFGALSKFSIEGDNLRIPANGPAIYFIELGVWSE